MRDSHYPGRQIGSSPDSFGGGLTAQRSGMRPALCDDLPVPIIVTVSGQILLAAGSGSAARVRSRPGCRSRDRAANLGRHVDISDRAAALMLGVR
jgi:hypothetical protein